MLESIHTDLMTLSRDELLELYRQSKSSNVAHRLWCLDHKDIPINFSINFQYLLKKLESLFDAQCLLDEATIDGDTDRLDILTIMLEGLIDSIYMECRSMFCERKKDNYTLQNSLKVANFIDEAGKIEKIIREERFEEPIAQKCSFWLLVKTVADKKIAHKDVLTEIDSQQIDYRFEFLLNPLSNATFLSYLYDIHGVYERAVMQYVDDELKAYFQMQTEKIVLATHM